MLKIYFAQHVQKCPPRNGIQNYYTVDNSSTLATTEDSETENLYKVTSSHMYGGTYIIGTSLNWLSYISRVFLRILKIMGLSSIFILEL